MTLTQVSGSQWPNAIALLYVALSVGVAFGLRTRSYKWILLALTVVLLAAVVLKDASYAAIVSGPHAENNLQAHQGYAEAVGWTAVLQLSAAAGLLTVGLCVSLTGWRLATTGRPVRSTFLGCLCAATAAASAYAAVCMFDWRHVYMIANASLPVHFSMETPILQWVALIAFVILNVGTLVSPFWRLGAIKP